MSEPRAITPVPLLEVEEALRDACGITLSQGLRGSLGDAFARAAREAGLEDREFGARLRARDQGALTALVEASVIGETYFFRHPEQFEALRTLALEPAPGRPLSIWSAGCATGEEPYSLAMALADAGRAGIPDRILATDVSARALAVARRGEYGAWSLRRLDPAVRERHFDGAPPLVTVRASLRAKVELARHNLVADPPPGAGYDLVVCRNVLIYFTPETAAAVAAKLFSAVAPGGLLVLGPVETAAADGLGAERIEVGGAALYRRPDGTAASPAAPERRAESGPRRPVRRHRAAARPVRPVQPARPAPPVLQGPPPVRAAGPAPTPAPAAGALEAARAAARRGDLDEADRMAREIAARDLSPEAYLLAAMVADARGDVAGAVDAVRRALYLDSGLAMAHATLVALFARLGLPDESARARRNALEAIEGLDDGAPLRGVEVITAGALRSALGARGRGAARAAGSDG